LIKDILNPNPSGLLRRIEKRIALAAVLANYTYYILFNQGDKDDEFKY